MLETQGAVLKLQSDLVTEVERLKNEVREKDNKLNQLESQHSKSLRELETMRAEIGIRNQLIQEFIGESNELSAISEANREIVSSSLRKNREIEPLFCHVRVGGCGDVFDYG